MFPVYCLFSDKKNKLLLKQTQENLATCKGEVSSISGGDISGCIGFWFLFVFCGKVLPRVDFVFADERV